MIEKTYQPADIEGRIYARWEEARRLPGRPARARATPSPSPSSSRRRTSPARCTWATRSTTRCRTSSCRFERMRGSDVLWQPGTDHAGIATQMVVERQLMERQEPGRREMGREEFLERVWAVEGRIAAAPSSTSSSGSAPPATGRASASPWTRACRAPSLKVFVELYREGLIYKDKRLVNWDPKLLDRDLRPRGGAGRGQGHLWHFRYPIEERSDDATSSWSPRRGPRRCWATPPSRCIRRTSATSDLDRQARRSCRWSAAASRSSPTNIPIPRRAPAR